jgi:hypothetical protein
VTREAQLTQPLCRRLYADGVVLAIQIGPHDEPCSGDCGADELQDLLVASQRFASPVLADHAEQAALDGVVFRCAGGIVSDRDGESGAIAKPLQLVFPGSPGGRVAATGVGEDEQMLLAGVTLASLPLPPSADGSNGESRGLVRDADEHGAAVGVEIVNAIENGNAVRLGAKVMVVHCCGRAIPLGAGVLEVAHQFPLLGVGADHRIPLSAETATQFADVGELRLAQGVSGADLLAVDTERKAKLVEESGHSAGADLNPQAVQLGRDLGRRLAGPLQTADGVARRVVL